MTNVILHIATSIDGFIADENGNTDFSFDAQEADPEFKNFYSSIGPVVMGRKTHDYLKSVEPEIFKDKEVFVITHYLRQKEDNVTFIHEDIMGCINRLKADSDKDIWVLGGSEIANILIKENLIDEVVLTTAPLLLGTGTRLFKNDNPMQKWQLKNVTSFDGFVQTTYLV